MVARRILAGGAMAVLFAGCAGPAGLAPDLTGVPTVASEGDSPPPGVDAAPAQADETDNSIARMVGYWPNTALVTHQNEKVKFYDDLVRDKCVLINFMYTNCDGI